MENCKKLSEQLIENSKVHYYGAVNHLFVEEMVNGTLDREKFKKYLIQDYVFINSFVHLVSYILAYSETMYQKYRFSKFLAMITSDENGYFIRSFEELGVSTEVYSTAELSPVMEKFLNLINKGIETGKEDSARGYRNCLAVLMCAESVYCDWGVKNENKSPKEYYFNEWIKLHNNEDFRELVKWLKEEVDNINFSNSDEEKEMKEFFEEACRLEIDFFEESYKNI